MIDHSALQRLEVASSTAPATMMISSAVRSCEGGELCGDIAFAFALDSGRTAIVVIDVAGHGAARSPLSSSLANEIASALRRDGSPAAALSRADEVLRASDDEIPYAVAFVATVHPLLRTIVYSSAGHDVAFTLADGGGTRNLTPTGPMLGIPLANHACDAVFTLGPRETLVIATDGISDSRPTGTSRFFGAVGTAQAAARSLRVGSDPAQAVLEAAYAHEGGPPGRRRWRRRCPSWTAAAAFCGRSPIPREEHPLWRCASNYAPISLQTRLIRRIPHQSNCER